MSHVDYVAKCDEEQLAELVRVANAQIKKIQESGWVRLWTVNVGWSNIAWYRADQRAEAVQHAFRAVAAFAQKWPDSTIEMEISLERYRPSEAADLLKRDKGADHG